MAATLSIVAGKDIEEMPFDKAVKLYNQCLFMEQFRADMVAQSTIRELNKAFDAKT